VIPSGDAILYQNHRGGDPPPTGSNEHFRRGGHWPPAEQFEKIVRISARNIIFIAFGDAILFKNRRAANSRPYGFFRWIS